MPSSRAEQPKARWCCRASDPGGQRLAVRLESCRWPAHPMPAEVGGGPEMVALAQVSLDDRYSLERGRVLMTGIQALVRLPMLQRQRDRAAGLNTAGFVSGYRGSPLGGLDQALWRARKFLEKSDIVFRPGLNEDLAATAVW